ncbi:hypothetical protein QM467_01455 [Rhodoblastus sp. 17X3]|uniref:hypothetical protein n=1 Tax=Rhodoblastus sp. 17X3 TaxID=3047026 RepID=UPI0024B67082|nr:hypothetical protein [Rhodoblastus sp. 17X3]MDI9846720.1 hypothetical protein [Rhodoblastus sp. 17X3]
MTVVSFKATGGTVAVDATVQATGTVQQRQNAKVKIAFSRANIRHASDSAQSPDPGDIVAILIVRFAKTRRLVRCH